MTPHYCTKLKLCLLTVFLQTYFVQLKVLVNNFQQNKVQSNFGSERLYFEMHRLNENLGCFLEKRIVFTGFLQQIKIFTTQKHLFSFERKTLRLRFAFMITLTFGQVKCFEAAVVRNGSINSPFKNHPAITKVPPPIS